MICLKSIAISLSIRHITKEDYVFQKRYFISMKAEWLQIYSRSSKSAPIGSNLGLLASVPIVF